MRPAALYSRRIEGARTTTALNIGVIAFAVVTVNGSIARADDDRAQWLPPTRPVPPEGRQPALDADERRPVPDYDGRGDDPTTAGDVLIWIPRGLFYPLYAVSEYVIRRPLRELVTWFDSTPSTDPFWTFGPGNKSGILPSAVIDFGFRPSIGVYIYSEDALVDGLELASHFAYGGPQWFRVTALSRYYLSWSEEERGNQLVQAKFIFSHRPDWIFYGIGPEADDGDASRYQAQFLEGAIKYQGGFWRSSSIMSWTGVRDARFEDEGCCAEPMIGEAVERGFYGLPPLFSDGYFVSRTGFALTIDTRPPRILEAPPATDWVQPSATGIRLATHLEAMGGLRRTDLPDGSRTQIAMAHWGGALTGFWDIYNQRTISLELFADFVDPIIAGRPIPFTELVSLGGSRPMQGFLERRLLGRSALVATLGYSYPIWAFLDGGIHYSIGNVFDKHARDFDPRLLRQSFGFGFRGSGSRDNVFELLIAFGSETFFRGGGLDTFRFVIGARDDYPLETK